MKKAKIILLKGGLWYLNCNISILNSWWCPIVDAPFSYRYGKIYVKAAKSIISKGANYAENEIARLERMLEKVSYNLSEYI